MRRQLTTQFEQGRSEAGAGQSRQYEQIRLEGIFGQPPRQTAESARGEWSPGRANAGEEEGPQSSQSKTPSFQA